MTSKLLPFLFLFLLSFHFACTKHHPDVEKITPMEAVGLLQNEFAVLVDVREQSEVQNGMAKPALWIPMSKIQKNAPEWQNLISSLSKDNKDKQVVFYCAGGVRAQSAAEKLTQAGYRAANMGGYNDWVGAKLPTKPQPE